MAFTNVTDEPITVRTDPGWSCTLFSGTGTPARLDMLQIMPIGGMPTMGVWETFPRPLKYAMTAGMGVPKSFDRESGVLSSSLPSGVQVTVSWFTSDIHWQGVGFTFRPQ